MASDRWQWDDGRKRFVDRQTGRALSSRTIRKIRDEYIAARGSGMRALADDVASGRLTIQAWETQFRAVIVQTLSAEYMLGRGGRNVMTPRDWGTVGSLAKEQYRYAHAFAEDIAAGRLSTADAVASRMAMYASAATEAHEIGRSEGYGMPRLPVYPADGGTSCLSNCKCSWSISETTTEWRASWMLGGTRHCSGCQQRQGEYSDYVIEKPAREAA